MAAGEYVSVSPQSDTDNADLEKARVDLEQEPAHDLKKLTAIYVTRGVDHDKVVASCARGGARQHLLIDKNKAFQWVWLQPRCLLKRPVAGWTSGSG